MSFLNLRKFGLFIAITFLVIVVHLGGSITKSLKTEKNEVSLKIEDLPFDRSYQIAVVGDLHITEDNKSLLELRYLIQTIKNSDPDLVLFLGDYIENPQFIKNLISHRKNVISILKSTIPFPSIFVMGNYESWSDPAIWRKEFATSNLDLLENETRIIETKKGTICIRGLGDSFTDRFTYVDYPAECGSLPKITITHDPEGAFHPKMRGLVLSGHTHCGQISLPLVGAIWVPSQAPRNATCGLYQDENITLYVTSGVGTSILPIRYGAQSEWDMVTLENSY
ncbi:phosphoesterase [Aequoribacter fuscus]|uniref:Phosphoesterase n=1 Tax=Aequoribacter fuscus TaxID=2518989 RepID=F3L2U8_9GAMM|nr:metallophosphoesterase [Aequoribacter fuscus]EGG29416.1 phosphoesterase [Aequoribacter fuscus]